MICKEENTERGRMEGQSQLQLPGCIHIMRTLEERALNPDNHSRGPESLIRCETGLNGEWGVNYRVSGEKA